MWRLATILATLGLACFVPAARAQPPCPADDIHVEARADTLFVQHRHAERNCCAALDLAFTVSEQIVDFFEAETGEPCDCICCFDLHYSACGFAAGHYTVRLWNGDGSELYGSVEVEVAGEASAPVMVTADLGRCVGPTEAAAPTWSLIKKWFR